MNEIMVSVICNVYNHEKFLRQTLDGFVTQVTDFDFEVLIHDDASTDESARIIKEYERKYPKIIKPIYQTENQYSKGISIMRNYHLPRLHGKYIAYCEGDDYWIDKYKLSKQVSYMESHPKCTFCFTNGIIKNVKTGKEKRFLPYNKSDIKLLKRDGRYSITDVASLSFIPTCSFFLPAKNYDLFPEYYWEKCFGGDRKLSLYSTALGYAYFIDEETCCYRYAVSGSAMSKKQSKEQIAEIQRSYINLYKKLNYFTQYKYDDFFKNSIVSYLKLIYCLQGEKGLISKKEKKTVVSSLTIKDKVKRVIISSLSDNLFNSIRNILKRFK